jgi:aspartate ammonia-lyase
MKKIITGLLFTSTLLTNMGASAQTRTEKDLLGEKQIPANAYYGVQTARALENFKVSGMATNFYPDYVRAYAMVKLAAARANAETGRLKKEKLDAIEKACQAVMDGKYHDQFLVDLYQGGAGTSANMNANEVLANIALEMSGHKKGEYQFIEPHDDLNMGQSTNDVYPTAIKVALLLHNDKLVKEAEALSASFHKKGEEFNKLLKMGRTEGQDAVPMTLGQEFHAFGNQLDAEITALKKSESFLCEQNMGATAIGTGITATPGYAEKCAVQLAKITGKPIVMSKDLIAATSSQQGFVIYSSALKSYAIALSKISSDLIFLASGPRTGIFEINLPALQPGSSIMPGKVNPVMPELMMQ